MLGDVDSAYVARRPAAGREGAYLRSFSQLLCYTHEHVRCYKVKVEEEKQIKNQHGGVGRWHYWRLFRLISDRRRAAYACQLSPYQTLP